MIYGIRYVLRVSVLAHQILYLLSSSWHGYRIVYYVSVYCLKRGPAFGVNRPGLESLARLPYCVLRIVYYQVVAAQVPWQFWRIAYSVSVLCISRVACVGMCTVLRIA